MHAHSCGSSTSKLALVVIVGLGCGALVPLRAEAQLLDRLKQARQQVEGLLENAVRCTFDDSKCIAAAKAQKEPVVLTDKEGTVLTDQDGKPITDPGDLPEEQATGTVGATSADPNAPSAARTTNDGRFTASVTNWPKPGSRAEFSGRAYVVTKDGRTGDHVVLCDASSTPWTLVFTGQGFPSESGEHALDNVTYATVYHTPGRPHAKGWLYRAFHTGMMRIEEVTGGLWVGSGSASRGDQHLQVSFRARSVAPGVVVPTKIAGAAVAGSVHKRGCRESDVPPQASAQERPASGAQAPQDSHKQEPKKTDAQEPQGLEKMLQAIEGLPQETQDEIYKFVKFDNTIHQHYDLACYALEFAGWRRENPTTQSTTFRHDQRGALYARCADRAVIVKTYTKRAEELEKKSGPRYTEDQRRRIAECVGETVADRYLEKPIPNPKSTSALFVAAMGQCRQKAR
jgi:hypothetical protein